MTKKVLHILLLLLIVSIICSLFYFSIQGRCLYRNFLGFSEKQTKEIEKIVHNYLLKNPTILVEISEKLQEKEKDDEKAKIKETEGKIPKYKNEIFNDKKPGRVVLGNPNGKIIIAELTQHQCPSCKKAAIILHKTLEDNPDLKIVVLYWPFLGQSATNTAKAVFAAKNQDKAAELNHAFFAYQDHVNKDKAEEIIKSIDGLDHEKLFSDMNNNEFNKGLQQNFKLAQDLGLTGTPALIITDQEMEKFILIPGKPPTFEKDLANAIKEMSNPATNNE